MERYGFVPVEIICACNPEVAYARFAARARRGERHPGHADGQIDFASGLWAEYRGLDMGCQRAVLDMSDFTAIDYACVYAALDDLLMSA